MENLITNSLLIPENVNADINIDLKAEGWAAVAIVAVICTSIVTIYCFKNNQLHKV